MPCLSPHTSPSPHLGKLRKAGNLKVAGAAGAGRAWPSLAPVTAARTRKTVKSRSAFSAARKRARTSSTVGGLISGASTRPGDAFDAGFTTIHSQATACSSAPCTTTCVRRTVAADRRAPCSHRSRPCPGPGGDRSGLRGPGGRRSSCRSPTSAPCPNGAARAAPGGCR